GIKDQELAVIAEGAGINHPTVARGGDLTAGPGRDRQPLFAPPDAVRSAKFPDFHATYGQRQHPLGGREADRRSEPAGVAQRRQARPAVASAVVSGARRRPRRSRGRVEGLLELDDKLIEVLGLAGQLRGALALVAELPFRLGLAFLPFLDEGG